MTFKEWLKNEMWISKGKANKSILRPGPRDIKPKPHDVKNCGQGGGVGSCGQQQQF